MSDSEKFIPTATEGQEKGNISDREVMQILHIVDTNTDKLDEVTPENIDEVLDKGIKKERENRTKLNFTINPKDFNSFENAYVNIFMLRFSESHAIQCSENGKTDLEFLKSIFKNKLKNMDNYPKEQVFDIFNFFNRQIDMKDVNSLLFKADILLRIADKKGEDNRGGDFSKKALEIFKNTKPKIEETIKNFEIVNSNKIELLPELKENIKTLKNILNNENTNLSQNDFYEKICRTYSYIIFSDFELINEKNLEREIKNLDKRLF